MKRILKPLALILIVGIGIWFVYVNRDKAASLQSVRAGHVIALIVIGLINISLNGYQLRVILQAFSLNLPFREWFGLSAVNSMLNYYIPVRGATVILAHYLKREYAFEYSSYVSVLSVYYLISFLVSALLGFIFTCIWGIIQSEWVTEFLVIYGLLLGMALLLAIALIRVSRFRLNTRFARLNNILNRIAQGLLIIREHRALLAKLTGLAAAAVVMFALQLYISFLAVGLQVSPFQILIIQCLASFSMILSITPANLGIREGIISASSRLFRLSMATSMMGAIVSRAMFMAVVFASGMVFSRVLVYGRMPDDQVHVPDGDGTDHE